MSNWAARARVHFAQEAQEVTPKTTKTYLVGVLGGHAGHPIENPQLADLASEIFSNHVAVNEIDESGPRSTAMNGAETSLFTARLQRFVGRGVIQIDADSLADKLVIRDREKDDRWLCFECTHLEGYGVTSWRCGNWLRAGISIRARDNQLPADLVHKLQRCGGFMAAHQSLP